MSKPVKKKPKKMVAQDFDIINRLKKLDRIEASLHKLLKSLIKKKALNEIRKAKCQNQ